MKGMKAKVKATSEIVEVREWRGASDIIYSTLDMNRFFAADEIEFVVSESESTFGWIARDKDGDLYYYDKKPERKPTQWTTDGIMIDMPPNMFPSLSWYCESIEVEVTIKPKKK